MILVCEIVVVGSGRRRKQEMCVGTDRTARSSSRKQSSHGFLGSSGVGHRRMTSMDFEVSVLVAPTKVEQV